MRSALTRSTLGVLVALGPAVAAAQTTVTVTAQRPVASEMGPAPGLFMVTRTGSLSSPLSVGFALSGTASPGSDYLVWDTAAVFAAGSPYAWVAALPVNDGLDETDETITLTLAPGAGYTIGSPAGASVTLQSEFLLGADGLWDPTDSALLEKDVSYLDALISGGNLLVEVGFNAPGTLNNLVIFLDTDRDPRTGDVRRGYMGGAEYRIEAVAGVVADYLLLRMPRSPADGDQDQVVQYGAASFAGGLYQVTIPLNLIGNPSGVDIVVTTFEQGGGTQISGSGDRAPDFGAFDAQSRKVVVRRPGVTRAVRSTDPAGDRATATGFDVTSLDFIALADQFQLTLEFAESFNPAQLGSVGPRGNLVVDGDRKVATGGLPLGSEIPTWGGEVGLRFDFTTPAPSLLLQFGGTASAVDFGGARNDGRWIAGAGVGDPTLLYLFGSLSLFDPISQGGAINLATDVKVVDSVARTGSDGAVLLRVDSYETAASPVDARVADSFPDRPRMADMMSLSLRDPYAFTGARQTATDPAELGAGVSGIDLVLLECEVIDGNLAVRGTLSTWGVNEVQNRFEVFLDTDMNLATGRVVTGDGGAIGADFAMRMDSVASPLATPVYVVDLIDLRVDRFASHDALLVARPAATTLETGSFAFTIPLDLVGPPRPQIRLYATTANTVDRQRRDIAPSAPIVVNLGGATANLAVTLQDSPDPIPVGADLTWTATVTNLGPDTATGATLTDTVPSGVALVSAGSGVGPCTGTTNLSCPLGTLAPGGSATVTIVGRPSAAGTVNNTVGVAANEADGVTANNSATAVTTVVRQANLVITKSDGLDAVAPGQPVVYMVTVTNAGPNPALGAIVTDSFPPSLGTVSWTCAGSGGATCTASGSGNINQTVNLPVGGSVTFAASATVSASATGSVANTSTVALPVGTTDPVPGDNSATDTDVVSLRANLAITKTGPPQAQTDASLTYTIVVRNLGPSEAAGVVVEDPAAPGLSFVRNDGDCATAFPCSLGPLPAGASRTILATFFVSPDHAHGPVLANAASVTSQTADPDPSNDADTEETPLLRRLRFYTLTPCRLLDTREPLGAPPLAPGVVRNFAAAGRCGIPPTAKTVSANVAVTEAAGPGHVRLFPAGAEVPFSSTVNYALGQTRANNANLGLGASGEIGVMAFQAAGTVQLIVDVNGYFE